MISDGRQFDTNVYFSGGAGMFIQYHDIVKPIYLYAIMKMIITKESFGLPIDLIKDFSFLSISEWYIKRRFKNPLKCLDFMNILDPNELDELMYKILINDDSIYKYSHPLNIKRMMNVYTTQHMSFPVYIYSEKEEPYIKTDCKIVFPGISTVKYLYGDLEDAIKSCDQNFTYIFSDIELAKKATEILTGTCSHVLVSGEYRYNYIDDYKTMKYDLKDLSSKHPYVRTGINTSTDIRTTAKALSNLRALQQGGI